MISVRRIPDKGTMFGGHAFSDDFAFAAEFPATIIEMYDENGVGLLMSRDEASALANSIRECLCDG